MTEFRHLDTRRPDGVYVTFTRLEAHDDTAHPNDYLFQDEDYREEDQARLDAWRNDEWSFIGIQAKADILSVRDGVGITHTMTSAGLWGIESDSGEDYLQGVFEEECNVLREDIKSLGALPMIEEA